MSSSFLRLLSWNVNGLRALLNRSPGFLTFLEHASADILCLQEVRARPEQLSEVRWPEHYHHFWYPAEKAGYSGTAIFTRIQPLNVSYGMGCPEQDCEGRVLTLEFQHCYLVNVYVPNSQRLLTRLHYRTQVWTPLFVAYLQRLLALKPVIFCGDLNVAHRPLDLARPHQNVRHAGFTPEERQAMDSVLGTSFLDTFREFESEGGHYTWWSYMNQSRARNVGWRIDYVLISKALRSYLQAAFIWPHIEGSDHCPVGIELDRRLFGE